MSRLVKEPFWITSPFGPEGPPKVTATEFPSTISAVVPTTLNVFMAVV